MKSRVNWESVRAAIKRSKYGRATEADQLLFEHAWGADPVQYRELHAEVGSEVFDEVAMVGPSKEKKP